MAIEEGLFEFIDTKYPEIFTAIRETKQINDETEGTLVKAITEFKAEFLK
jgi:F-type H+-transporting ATPase subunit alpha